MNHEKRTVSASYDSNDEILSAATVPLPGGVNLTDEEKLFRQGTQPKAHGRRLIVARSILRKVRAAVAQ